MKLHREIIELQANASLGKVAESIGPITYAFVLDAIHDKQLSGEELDTVQAFVLANLIWFFSSGRTSTDGQLDGIVNIESNATSTEAIEAVRSLSAKDIEKLTTELQLLITLGNRASPAVIQNENGMTPNEWVEYVLKRQD